MAGKRVTPLVLSVALGLIAMAPPAVEAQGPGPAGAPPERDVAAPYKALGADDGQLNQIRESSKLFEQESQGRAKQMMTLMRDMRQLMMQPDPDEKAVMAKQDEINKVQVEQAMARTKLMLKVRGILSPEQKQRLVQMMQQGRGPGGGPASGPGSAGGGPAGGPGGGPQGNGGGQ